jgi:C1A family cysteine protease
MKKIIIILLLSFFCIVSSISTGFKIEEKNLEKKVKNIDNDQYYNEYSVMRVNPNILERWEEDYNSAEIAFIDPDLEEKIELTESFNILDLLEYIPEERNQGRCSNCWAWPPTAILAIALNVQEGIKDRLSVQFINTCGIEYTTGMNKIECCEGGNIAMFADFYKNTNYAIPWSNTMAHWHDGSRINCVTDCNEILKTPNYPIYDIDDVTIPIRGVPTDEAIENIKNVLHQQKGVYFSVFYPDLENLNTFRDMWRNEDEDFVYDLDYYCGNEVNSEESAGHAMLIYGYNDEEGTENDYWMVLNSWGINDNRPNGLLKWDMHMNYDCKYSNYFAFGANTLDVIFDPDPEAPEPPTIYGPSRIKPEVEYTYELTAIDPQGDDVYIYIKWDTGFSGSGWLGPFESGEKIQVSHKWDEEDNIILRARARDNNSNIGPWSSFEISISKIKSFNYPSKSIQYYNQHLFLFIWRILNL